MEHIFLVVTFHLFFVFIFNINSYSHLSKYGLSPVWFRCGNVTKCLCPLGPGVFMGYWWLWVSALYIFWLLLCNHECQRNPTIGCLDEQLAWQLNQQSPAGGGGGSGCSALIDKPNLSWRPAAVCYWQLSHVNGRATDTTIQNQTSENNDSAVFCDKQ